MRHTQAQYRTLNSLKKKKWLYEHHQIIPILSNHLYKQKIYKLYKQLFPYIHITYSIHTNKRKDNEKKNHICLFILIPPVKSISQFIYPIPIPINDPRPIVTILLKLPPYSWLHSASTTSKTSNNHMEFKLKIKSPTKRWHQNPIKLVPSLIHYTQCSPNLYQNNSKF